MMKQQIVSFEELYDHVKEDGVYVCEDVHTSYWPEFGGGFKNPDSFIEFSKSLIDKLNAYHSKSKLLQVDPFTRSTDSIHFYDSMIVIEKRVRTEPFHEKSGSMSFEETLADRAKMKAKHTVVKGKTTLKNAFRSKD